MEPWIAAAGALMMGVAAGCYACFLYGRFRDRKIQQSLFHILCGMKENGYTVTRSPVPEAPHGDGAWDRMVSETAGFASRLSEFSRVLELAGEGLVIVDGSDMVRFANPALLSMLGVPPPAKRWVGTPLINLCRQRELMVALRSFRAGEGNSSLLISHRGREIKVAFQEISPGTGKDNGTVLILWSDMTQLLYAERAGKELVSNVAHQLRTPLTAIKGYAETLLDGGVDDPELSRRFLGTILRNTDRLTSLVSDILTLARLDGVVMVVDEEPVNLQDLIIEAVESLGPDMEERGIRIRTVMPDVPVTVRGSAKDLEQAFFNIMDNAVKYTGSGTTVTVRLEVNGSEAVLSVEDHGPGIPLDLADRIFERFFRIEGNRDREIQGTGLGLAIARQIVEVHGGAIRYESQTGKGTTFFISLPCAADGD